MGKGRTIAGVIYENYLKVSRPLHLSFHCNPLEGSSDSFLYEGSEASYLGVSEQ